MAEKRALVGGAEHVERRLVHVDHPDLAHALPHELGVDVGEDPQIHDAARAQVFEKLPDLAEILDPERGRRMFEDALGVAPAGAFEPARLFAGGHILAGQKDPLEALLGSGQHRAAQLDIEPAPAQRVVDRKAGEGLLACPELRQLVHMALEHVVAEDPFEVLRQMVEIARLVEGERAGIHLENPDAARTGGDARQVGLEEGPDVGHALGAPLVEQGTDAAEILDPHRDRGKIEGSLFDRPRRSGHAMRLFRDS
ncbi:hypothetical protein DWF04_018260 [Cereibacter sphaeroides f. sp. denitrificans]